MARGLERAVIIRVTFFSASLTEAAVHIRPSLIARLLGARETDDIATAVAPGDGRRVEDRSVLREIERAWRDEKHRQVDARLRHAFAKIEAIRARRGY